MIKLLVLVMFFVLIYLFLFKKRQSVNQNSSKEGETMVECEHCKTFISMSESISKNGHTYCSKKCAGDVKWLS